jgi:polyisoprenoid-binding protein YceI
MRTNLHPAHVEADGLEGFIDAEFSDGAIDPTAPAAARIEFPVGRLTSDNGLFKREVQKRIGARRHPSIVGELRTVRALDEPGRYAVTGDLAFRGVTRSVEGEVHVGVSDQETLNVEGQQVFDIRDFGIEPPRLLMLKAYPDVTVRVRIVARRES